MGPSYLHDLAKYLETTTWNGLMSWSVIAADNNIVNLELLNLKCGGEVIKPSTKNLFTPENTILFLFCSFSRKFKKQLN